MSSTGEGLVETTVSTEDTAPVRQTTKLTLRGILPGDWAAVELRGAPVSIGRGRDCSFRLDRPKVSRIHAEIYREGPLVALRDAGSTNGTYLEGSRIEHASLRAGALIRIGDWLGTVEDGGNEDPVATPFAELGPGLFGGAQLRLLVEQVVRAAAADLPVVVVGSTGSGKERFAQVFHASSGRAGPFQAVNCAALPDHLAEAELFGYRRGAFTGADRNHTGYLSAAHGGTLFLDELADLEPRLQAKLLRAIELREAVPLGETTPRRFDVRLVSACQQPIDELVASGRLRHDLVARLAGLVIHVPPLHGRRADIPSLFDQFLRSSAHGSVPSVSTRFYERLCLHPWPGNVRELEMLARNLGALHDGKSRLRRSHLPPPFLAEDPALGGGRPRTESRRDHDRRRLARALAATAFNVQRAAEMIGISRQRAYRLMAGQKASDFAEQETDRKGSDDFGE